VSSNTWPNASCASGSRGSLMTARSSSPTASSERPCAYASWPLAVSTSEVSEAMALDTAARLAATTTTQTRLEFPIGAHTYAFCGGLYKTMEQMLLQIARRLGGRGPQRGCLRA